MEELSGHEIAVVGAAGRFPGAKTVAALWDNLIAGRSSLGPSENEAASTPIPRGTGHWVNTNALLAEFDHFDAPFFGVPPGEAQLLDPQNRLFLECCWEALEDAAAARTSAGSNTGVFGSSGFSLYASQNFSGRDKLLEVFPTLLSVDKDYLTTRVAHLLQLRGPAITIQSACSSSLVAVHLACRSLQAGDCDAALAGGVSLDFGHRDDHQFFMPGGMLSPDGRCRPFNADSNGTVFSEGVCVVFLMRLEDAVKQRKHIYSVILGSAVNNDGEPGIGFTAPSSRGQADVLARAMAIAGINPSQVGFVEAHGTGTVLGDAIELAGLADAFGAGAAPDSCVLGSLKSNIGHLATAAGVASLVKASLVVKTGRIPPTAHFRVPNQDLSLSPFLVNPETIEWPFVGPRRAGVSSFGVGGTNAHVVLQEPPTILTSQPSRRCYPIIVSAKSESSARKMVERAAADLEMIPNGEFANAAYTMALGRSEFEHRAALLAHADGRVVSVRAPPASTDVQHPKICFMFPGQGSQRPSMGRELYEHEPLFRAAADKVFKQSKAILHFDLRHYMLEAMQSEDSSLQTEFAQPAIFALEYSLAQTLKAVGVEPDFMIGHSLGEYVAACCSGVLSLEDTLRLVGRRGQLMQRLPGGAMVSVAAAAADIADMLPSNVEIAAINGEQLCVIAGPSIPIDDAVRLLTARGLQTRRLRTSHAFHSAMMDGMLAEFGEAVRATKLGNIGIPYSSNILGGLALQEEVKRADYWLRQVREPVQFLAGIQAVRQAGATMFIEVGPGGALTGLVEQAAPSARVISLLSRPPESPAFLEGLSKIWIAGAPVDWSTLFHDEARTALPLSTYAFDHKSYSIAPSAAVKGPPLGGKLPVAEWTYLPTWTRGIKASLRAVDPNSGRVVVVAKAISDARMLASGFGGPAELAVSEAVAEASDIQIHLIDDDDPNAFEALFLKLERNGLRPDIIIHASSIQSVSEPTASGGITDTTGRLLDVGRIAKSWHNVFKDAPLEMVIATRGSAQVMSSDHLRPLNAGLYPMALIASQEYPFLTQRVIDFDCDDFQLIGGIVARELRLGRKESPVAIRDGQRWLKRFERIRGTAGDSSQSFKERGTYLLIGGLGNIGLELSLHLAINFRAHLVLTGRTPIPEQREWQTLLSSEECAGDSKDRLQKLLQIHECASSLTIINADAGDHADMIRARQTAMAQSDAIDGVMFLAGSLTGGLLEHELENPERLIAHLHVKAKGVEVAANVFGADTLDFFTVFSSISTVLGGLGHAFYAASNAVAEALVAHTNATKGTSWNSIAWDLWRGTSLTATQTRNDNRLQGLAIDGAEGHQALQEILLLPQCDQLVVSTHDLHERLSAWVIANRSEPDETQILMRYDRPELATPFESPEGQLEKSIAELWEDALSLQKVGRHDDFFELGGQSLLAMKISGRLRNLYEIDVSVEDIFTTNTIASLACLVDTRLGDLVEHLNDEEVDKMLNLRADEVAAASKAIIDVR